MSAIYTALFGVLIAFTLFALVFPNTVGDLSNQIQSKTDVNKYLPEMKIKLNKEVVTNEVKDYSFDMLIKILDDSSISESSNLKQGHLLKVERDILEDEFLIGFFEIDGQTRLYVAPDSDSLYTPSDLDSLKESSATYFENTLFKQDVDREKIQSLLTNKIFVIMPRTSGFWHEETALFFHYITGNELDSDDAKDLKLTYTFEQLLQRHSVKTLAFSTGKEMNVYYEDLDGDQVHEEISKKGDDYLLIYRYENYVVFFPIRTEHLGVDVNDEGKIDGRGRMSNQMFEDIDNNNWAKEIN